MMLLPLLAAVAVSAAGAAASGAIGASGAKSAGRAARQGATNAGTYIDDAYSGNQQILSDTFRDTGDDYNRQIKEGNKNDNMVLRMLGTNPYTGFTADNFSKNWKTDKKLRQQGIEAGVLGNVNIDPRTGRKIINQNGVWGSIDATGKFRKVNPVKIKSKYNADGSFIRYGFNPDGTAWTRQFDKNGKALGKRKLSQELRRTDKFDSWTQEQEKAGRDAWQNDPIRGDLLKPYKEFSYQESPGYQYNLAETEKGINRAAAARGLWDSGATMKALSQNAHDLANQDFKDQYGIYAQDRDSYYNRLSGVYNMLSGQQARGDAALDKQNANQWRGAELLAQNNQWRGSNFASLETGAGQSDASARLGASQSWSNAANSIAGILTAGAMNYAKNRNQSAYPTGSSTSRTNLDMGGGDTASLPGRRF